MVETLKKKRKKKPENEMDTGRIYWLRIYVVYITKHYRYV